VGLTVKLLKVVFAAQEISFLGHRVPSLRVSINPDHNETIRRFSPPKDVKRVICFIGMVNFL
jgi:hypothetical protein